MNGRPQSHHGARLKSNSPARSDVQNPVKMDLFDVNRLKNLDRKRFNSAAKLESVEKTNEDVKSSSKEDVVHRGPIKRGNMTLLPYGNPQDLTYAIVQNNKPNRNFYSTELTADDKETLIQVGTIVNQIVFIVSMEFAQEQNASLLSDVDVYQTEVWREEMEKNQSKELRTLYKQATIIRKKKLKEQRTRKRSDVSKITSPTAVVDKDMIYKSLLKNHKSTEMDYPFRWDHVTSMTTPNPKNNMGWSYPTPSLNQHAPESKDYNLALKVSEILLLQSETIRKEKQEAMGAKKSSKNS
ncbi:hypothetical protein AKO1_007228 [Acrasis kona]|uniref:Uncharacterized protein n=1 Tax=Acrasis kona TaxID=1008807 RepID=A0AAW2YTK2_9EUKA